MHLQLKTEAALAALILTTLLSGCSDSTSTQQFGGTLDTSSLSSTGESTTEEETVEEGSSTSPPDNFPTPVSKTVEFNNRVHAVFEIAEAGIAYILVNNPEQQNFDSWLMDDAEYQDYETARYALPQSADPSHQNYKAQYGIDLSNSMANSIPVNTSLLPDNYHIVIDNTDLGGNNTFNDEAVSYSFVVFIGSELEISSEDVD